MVEQEFSYSPRVNYMLEGARASRYHSHQWFRYLRKGLSGSEVALSPDDIQVIEASGVLTMFQVITLRRAMEPGTITNQRVMALNQKSSTPMVEELLRRYKHV